MTKRHIASTAARLFIAPLALAACTPSTTPEAEPGGLAGGVPPAEGAAPPGAMGVTQGRAVEIEDEQGARPCGGIAGLACAPGYECVDDPKDDCDPGRGGQDCSGTCMKPAVR